MNRALDNNELSRREVERVEKLPIVSQLNLVATSRGSSIENRLTGAAIAVTVSRIVQLSKEDQLALWHCVKDCSTIKTQEDAAETAETILEILDPMDSPPKLVDLNEWSERNTPEKCKKWLAYVSSRIRLFRAERKLTQTELARLSGLPQSHISRLERGVHSPSHGTLKKLADVFGVEVNQLDPSL
jgi:DNA-binding XRE family transcriptional regulator